MANGPEVTQSFQQGPLEGPALVRALDRGRVANARRAEALKKKSKPRTGNGVGHSYEAGAFIVGGVIVGNRGMKRLVEAPIGPNFRTVNRASGELAVVRERPTLHQVVPEITFEDIEEGLHREDDGIMLDLSEGEQHDGEVIIYTNPALEEGFLSEVVDKMYGLPPAEPERVPGDSLDLLRLQESGPTRVQAWGMNYALTRRDQ